MLTREQIVTIEVLQQRGQSQRETARILGVSEGAVRYHLRRARDAAADGRSKPSRIEQLGLADAVARWWHAQAEALGQERPPSVLLLQEFLRDEFAYDGSYKLVRKFVRARYGRPPVRPFRRILLANSDQATNRANRDVRVAARGTPPTQSESR